MASLTMGALTLSAAVYEGPLVNNKPMGRGELTFPDESRIEGTFWGIDNVVGFGTLNLPGGYRYEGAIMNYQAHGPGTILNPASTPILAAKFESGELVDSKRRKAIEAQVGRIELLSIRTARAPQTG